MIMNYSEEKLQQYLPDIEEFLTDLLLENANIEIASFKNVDHSEALSEIDKSSIFLYTRDSKHLMDIIIILGEEWYGLLSSIKKGIEMKNKNDTTTELVREFMTDLSNVVVKKMNDEGSELPELEEIQILSLSDLEEALGHSDYFLSNLEIKDIADNPVYARCLLGNPNMLLKKDKHTADEEKDLNQKNKDYSSVERQKAEEGNEKASIFGRHRSFTNFGEATMDSLNEEYNINLLEDVELNISVELGRAELPIEKVLQLIKGSVLELDELANQPVDIMANGRLLAHGEVVVIDEHFGVRISDFITTKNNL